MREKKKKTILKFNTPIVIFTSFFMQKYHNIENINSK